MKRDWDVVRKILIEAEIGRPLPGGDYHKKILGQSGLVSRVGLTAEGRNLLGHIRSDTRWGEIKAVSKAKDIGLTTDSIPIIAGSLST